MLMPVLTLYAIGPRLHRYAFDPETGKLAHAESVMLPGNGQYAVFHPAGNYLYAATGKPPQPLFMLAFAIDGASGALRRSCTLSGIFGRFYHYVSRSRTLPRPFAGGR